MLRSSKTKIHLYTICLLVVLAAVGNIWIRTETVKQAYRYVEFEKELRALQQGVQRRRVNWLGLTSPKQMERLAKRLDLYPPRVNQLLRYETKRRSGKRVK